MPHWNVRFLSIRGLFIVSCVFFIYSFWIAVRWQHCKVVHWMNLPKEEALNEEFGGTWYKLRHQADARALFFSRLQSSEALCETVQYLSSRYGHFPLCIADHFIPISPCVVFSFNINQQTTSDSYIAQKYDCFVNVFDPLLDDLSPERHPKLNVFRFCIGTYDSDNYRPPLRLLYGGDKRQTWGLRSYRSLMSEVKYSSSRMIDVIKISVAGMEYGIIEDMLHQNQLRSVKQLLIHFYTDVNRREDYFRYLNLLIRLNSQGFRIFYGFSNYTKIPCIQGVCDVHSIGFINVLLDT